MHWASWEHWLKKCFVFKCFQQGGIQLSSCFKVHLNTNECLQVYTCLMRITSFVHLQRNGKEQKKIVLSWCHFMISQVLFLPQVIPHWWRIILFSFRFMNMVKLFKKAFWKFSLDIKIACYLDVKVHFSSLWKEEESWIQA